MKELAAGALGLELEAYVRGERGPATISLSGFTGSWVVLAFYPNDFTFICPTELAALAELHEQFEEEGAALLAASTDSYHSHKAWFESDARLAAVRYPVIADTTHRLSSAFAVLGNDGVCLRGTFVLDPQGAVRHASVTDVNVGRAPLETLRVLQALKTGELCPAYWQPGEPTLTELARAA